MRVFCILSTLCVQGCVCMCVCMCGSACGHVHVSNGRWGEGEINKTQSVILGIYHFNLRWGRTDEKWNRKPRKLGLTGFQRTIRVQGRPMCLDSKHQALPPSADFCSSRSGQLDKRLQLCFPVPKEMATVVNNSCCLSTAWSLSVPTTPQAHTLSLTPSMLFTPCVTQLYMGGNLIFFLQVNWWKLLYLPFKKKLVTF